VNKGNIVPLSGSRNSGGETTQTSCLCRSIEGKKGLDMWAPPTQASREVSGRKKTKKRAVETGEAIKGKKKRGKRSVARGVGKKGTAQWSRQEKQKGNALCRSTQKLARIERGGLRGREWERIGSGGSHGREDWAGRTRKIKNI